MQMISSEQLSEDKIYDFFNKQWGSPKMVISSGIFDCTKLEGFAMLNYGQSNHWLYYIYYF